MAAPRRSSSSSQPPPLRSTEPHLQIEDDTALAADAALCLLNVAVRRNCSVACRDPKPIPAPGGRKAGNSLNVLPGGREKSGSRSAGAAAILRCELRLVIEFIDKAKAKPGRDLYPVRET
jgi:hypothetical protein